MHISCGYIIGNLPKNALELPKTFNRANSSYSIQQSIQNTAPELNMHFSENDEEQCF